MQTLTGQDSFKFGPVTDIPVEGQNGPLLNAWAGGLNAAQFGTIDLNADNLEDLCVFDRTTNKVSTFINTGSGYQYQPQFEYFFPENLNSWMLLADYNCDGKKDIFTNTTFGLKVYKNTSTDQLSFELQVDPLLSENGGQMVNLQVSSSDIPAISDVDGDGDLDILTFKFVAGNSIEYHQNQSMETGGNCDLLQFKLVDSKWGDFEECACGEYVFGETCNEPGGRRQHAGGKSLLLFDQDHDGAMELIFGDEFCTNIAFLYNEGDAANALFNNAVLDFPNADNPIDFFIFPGMFMEDVTFDGNKDLIASPGVFENFGMAVDFLHSSYLYPNDGVAGSEVFSALQTDQFLQDQMVELGESASPAFIDVDGDGDDDLIVGNRGIRNNNGVVSSFQLYENNGTLDQASFKLVSSDYLDLSSLLLNTLKPSFADLNGNGRKDLLFSAANSSGQTNIYYFLNQSDNGFEPVNALPQLLDFVIQAGDSPYFQDINLDGKADLLLGRRTGRLEYWSNASVGSNFSFELTNDAFAGIIDDSFRRELFPMAADINNDGQLELVTTDATGVMRVYTNFIDPDGINPLEMFEYLIEPVANQPLLRSRLGRGTAVAAANLGSQLPHLVLGSRQGGLFLLENQSIPGNNPNGENFTMELFPNPGDGQVTLRGNQHFIYEIYNSQGQRVMESLPVPKNLAGFDSRLLAPGIYLINGISITGAKYVQKLIVIN
ncbi:MAG: hypothetical protein DHS20C17_12830 [Cyclobacteriaceae bacterium]|nr:MAG: hypothetical protein DHS20C17_12830 [Cyclobacteriaceae bacterium]